MALYLTLSEGTGPESLRPVLATTDSRIIQAVLTAIARLGQRRPQPVVTHPAALAARGVDPGRNT